jgi:hypothetical protein
MKRNFTLVSAWILLALGVSAQTSDNFNSRPGITTSQVKGHLQGQCWQFVECDVNNSGWVPAIEGDGAMATTGDVTPTAATGIYTPVLDVPGYISISFKYKFNHTFGNGAVRRWLKIYLTDQDNNVVSMIDSIEFTNVSASTVYDFNKSFSPVGSGLYKVYLNYQGELGSTAIAIDQLVISASRKYNTGCNAPPVAVNDNIPGSPNHHASGKVTINDSDPNNDTFGAILLNGSPDGEVVFFADGNFTFTPNENFTGNTTSFTYMICDNGAGSLCSEPATVTLTFPTNGNLPVSLVDFKGLYKDDGKVLLSWVTTFEQNSKRFDIERSLDGVKWETAGTVNAQGVSTVKHSYEFMDEVSNRTASKKDLYYRLRQVDLDGRVAVSKILIVRVYNTRTLKMVSVTPNPSKNDITVTVQLNEDAMISMKILSSTGAMVMNKTTRAGAGNNSYFMDGTSKLRPGMYVLEVTINQRERMIVKLIKE